MWRDLTFWRFLHSRQVNPFRLYIKPRATITWEGKHPYSSYNTCKHKPFEFTVSETKHLMCSHLCHCAAKDTIKLVISSGCRKGGRAEKMLLPHLLGEHSRNPSGPVPQQQPTRFLSAMTGEGGISLRHTWLCDRVQAVAFSTTESSGLPSVPG